MKKKITLLVAVCGLSGALAAPSASVAAECADGTSQARDEYGNPTGEDTLLVVPGRGVIYGDGAEEDLNPGYLGMNGTVGYIEISGNNDADPNVQVDGKEWDGSAEGRAGVDTGSEEPVDVCVNGDDVP